MNRDVLIKCVELQLGRKNVKMEDRFINDLGAESVDMVHLADLIEEQTGLFIPIETVPGLYTVQNLYDYIISQ